MNHDPQHILVVEDEEAHSELIRRAFAAHPGRFHLTFAGSLAEASACLADAKPSLIIADLRPPDELGTRILPKDGETLNLPLLVMTAHGDETAAVEAIKAGALEYLVKSDQVLSEMPRIAERVLREWHSISARKMAEQALIGLSRENAVMAEIGRIVNSSLDIDEVYSRIGIEVGKLIHFDRLSISVVNEENDTVAITFIAGLEIPESPVGRLFPLSESSSIHVTKTKTTQLILPRSEHELAESVPVMLILYRAGLKSFIVVPLISKGRVIAVLRLGSFEVNSYDHDEVRVAE